MQTAITFSLYLKKNVIMFNDIIILALGKFHVEILTEWHWNASIRLVVGFEPIFSNLKF